MTADSTAPAASPATRGRSAHTRWTRAGVLAVLVLAACERTAGWDAGATSELQRRVTQDQALRDTMVGALQANRVDSALTVRLRAQDSVNGAWLKAMVRERGWPGIAAVGREAATGAFLLVQHDRTDTTFQVAALRLIEAAYRRHDVDGQALALLTDELLVDRGMPQQYGTKARLESGALVFEPIADSAHVDERRAALGMPPLQVYADTLAAVYGLPFRRTPRR